MPALDAIEKQVLKSQLLGTAPANYTGYLALLEKVPAKAKASSKAEVFAQEKKVTEEWAAYTRFKLGTGAGEGELEYVASENGAAYYTNGKPITFPTTSGMAAKTVVVEYFAVWDVATLSEAGNPIFYGALESPLTISKALVAVEFQAKALKLGAE
jgi:hypothetical protein